MRNTTVNGVALATHTNHPAKETPAYLLLGCLTMQWVFLVHVNFQEAVNKVHRWCATGTNGDVQGY